MINLAKYLTLVRPLAVIDLETTGLDPVKDRIIQITATKHYPDPHRDPITWSSFVNPGILIPTDIGVNVTDEQVANAPTFEQIAPALAPKITDVDIAGYNVTFDIGFLRESFKRANVPWPWDGYIIDAYNIYCQRLPRNLTNAYREFGANDGGPTDESFEGAHDSRNDVLATEIVLRGQLLRFKDLPRTVKELSAVCFPQKENAVDKEGKIVWHQGEACIAFGKHARNGPLPLRKLDRGYMDWIINGSNLPDDVKQIMRDALQGKFPEGPRR